MKPDWPFINEEEDKEEQDGAWSKIADVPIRYHVYYRMLDGDQEGRAPSDDGFDPKTESNFKSLLRSPNREVYTTHLISDFVFEILYIANIVKNYQVVLFCCHIMYKKVCFERRPGLS